MSQVSGFKIERAQSESIQEGLRYCDFLVPKSLTL
jgi:hypothetical protein